MGGPKGDTVKSKGLYFFIWNLKRKSSIGNWIFFVHHRIASAVKRVEFVSPRLSFLGQRGCWCNIIVLSVRAPSEEKVMIQKTVFMGN